MGVYVYQIYPKKKYITLRSWNILSMFQILSKEFHTDTQKLKLV